MLTVRTCLQHTVPFPIRVVKLQVMLVAEVLPNIISYNSALRAVQSAHWPIALILFESMVRNRRAAVEMVRNETYICANQRFQEMPR